MTKEEMIVALNAMLEQGNQLRASELIPILTELAGNAGNAAPIEVEDITGLTADQLDALQPGNVVVKKTGNERYVYTVNFKDGVTGVLQLTYANWQDVECVYYDKSAGDWAYVITESTHITTETPAPPAS